MAAHRPAGYYEDVVSRGKVVGDQLELSPEAYADLVAKYQQPAENWPAWTLVVSLFATPEDHGIGDTIRREIGPPKSESFKRFHEAMFGVWAQPCGCGELKKWNAQYPYNFQNLSASALVTSAM